MQRYGEKLRWENPFNESPRFFSEADYLYFVSTSLTAILVQMDDFFVKTGTLFGGFGKMCFLCTRERD